MKACMMVIIILQVAACIVSMNSNRRSIHTLKRYTTVRKSKIYSILDIQNHKLYSSWGDSSSNRCSFDRQDCDYKMRIIPDNEGPNGEERNQFKNDRYARRNRIRGFN